MLSVQVQYGPVSAECGPIAEEVLNHEQLFNKYCVSSLVCKITGSEINEMKKNLPWREY